jgi:hypothetical protein
MAAGKKLAGLGMFVIRSLFWLTAVVAVLPPASDGDPAPRVSLLQAAYATRILIEDVTGVCDRNPEACATSQAGLALLGRKLETGAGLVATGFGSGDDEPRPAAADHGTLIDADLEPTWAVTAAAPSN